MENLESFNPFQLNSGSLWNAIKYLKVLMTFSYKVNHIWWYIFVGNDCKKIHFQMRYTATSIRSKALVILIKLK